MSNQEFGGELNPGTTNFVEATVAPDNLSELPQGECFKAKVLRAAFDISPTKIPEDFGSVGFDGYTCPFVSGDGKECAFKNPMITLQHKVGFVAMSSTNFCKLELDLPQEFKRVAFGGARVRVARFVRELGAIVGQKFAE